jgi:hypothetical protein
MSLLGNIKTKLGTYGLKDYVPPPHLSVPNLDRVWTLLMRAENQRSMTINQKIREIKEWLRKQFSIAANEFALCLNTVAMEISGLDGDPEVRIWVEWSGSYSGVAGG